MSADSSGRQSAAIDKGFEGEEDDFDVLTTSPSLHRASPVHHPPLLVFSHETDVMKPLVSDQDFHSSASRDSLPMSSDETTIKFVKNDLIDSFEVIESHPTFDHQAPSDLLRTSHEIDVFSDTASTIGTDSTQYQSDAETVASVVGEETDGDFEKVSSPLQFPDPQRVVASSSKREQRSSAGTRGPRTSSERRVHKSEDPSIDASEITVRGEELILDNGWRPRMMRSEVSAESDDSDGRASIKTISPLMVAKLGSMSESLLMVITATLSTLAATIELATSLVESMSADWRLRIARTIMILLTWAKASPEIPTERSSLEATSISRISKRSSVKRLLSFSIFIIPLITLTSAIYHCAPRFCDLVAPELTPYQEYQLRVHDLQQVLDARLHPFLDSEDRPIAAHSILCCPESEADMGSENGTQLRFSSTLGTVVINDHVFVSLPRSVVDVSADWMESLIPERIQKSMVAPYPKSPRIECTTEDGRPELVHYIHLIPGLIYLRVAIPPGHDRLFLDVHDIGKTWTVQLNHTQTIRLPSSARHSELASVSDVLDAVFGLLQAGVLRASDRAEHIQASLHRLFDDLLGESRSSLGSLAHLLSSSAPPLVQRSRQHADAVMDRAKTIFNALG